MYETVYHKDLCEKIQVRLRKQDTISLLQKYPHQHILEIGCGDSPLFADFSDYSEMTVVEPGLQFIEHARELAQREGKTNIVFVQGMLEEKVSQLSEHHYDHIILSGLLHEVEKPEQLLRDVFQLCSPETIVYINVPNAMSLHRLLAKELGIIQDVHDVSERGRTMQQHSVFDLQSLCALTEQCGFTVLEKGSFIPKFLSYSQMEQMLHHQIIDERFFDALNSISALMPEYGSEIYVLVKRSSSL